MRNLREPAEWLQLRKEELGVTVVPASSARLNDKWLILRWAPGRNDLRVLRSS